MSTIMILILADLVTGLVLIVFGIPMVLEKIKLNNYYGFRTKKTLSNDTIWYAANKYAGKTMIIAGIFMIVSNIIVYIINTQVSIMDMTSETVLTILWSLLFGLPILIMLIASLLYLRKL